MAQYQKILIDGGELIVEVDEAPRHTPVLRDAGAGVLRGGEGRAEKVVEQASSTFNSALAGVAQSANAIRAKLASIAEQPDEVELTLGLKVTAEGNLAVAKAGAEANFAVRMVWRRKPAG